MSSSIGNRVVHALAILILGIMGSGFGVNAYAQSSTVENVILVTLDGLRRQELFGGAEKKLIDKEIGNVDDPVLLEEKYWDPDPVVRRQRLMPFFWDVVAKQGQVFGSPAHRSVAKVENGRYFSYPGYSELLCGFADRSIDSNDKKYNQNTTVLERLNQLEPFKNRVAAFSSWDVFPYIINDKRSGVYVNAGWTPLEHFSSKSDKAVFDQMFRTLPRYWQSVRYDIFTFRGASEYLNLKRPRVLYVSLGETDDWAHAGRYDLYLESATVSDQMIRKLWEQVQSMDDYRGKTAMIISTDHGRGNGREGWKNHSDELPGSEFIWIAAIGPGIPALGIRKDTNATQGQVAATVGNLLGHDFRKDDDRIAAPLTLAPDNYIPDDHNKDAISAVAMPLKHAHAHNDYYHERPLLDALDNGFCSVEADIFLVDDELRVGHSRFELKPGRTLESLYLQPLQQRIQTNNGQVYRQPARFTLLVDIKTESEKVYPVLRAKLQEYRNILCRVEDGKFYNNAVQVVISGDRPRKLIAAEKVRFCGIDGRIDDLDSDTPAHWMPLISDRWSSHFKWRGRGEMPEYEQEKLKRIVDVAHRAGRRVRFWATPEKPRVWQVLLDAGVDHVNTDQLEELRAFLLKLEADPPQRTAGTDN